MTDPLYALRDVEVPVGARARVRARIEDHLDRAVLPNRRPFALAIVLTATAAVAALLAVFALPREASRREIAAPAVAPSAEPIVVAAETHSHEAAPIATREDTQASKAAFDALVRGAAQTIVHSVQLTLRVVAGSVHVAKPVITTETIELAPAQHTVPAVRERAHVEEVAARAASPVEPIEPIETAPPPDKLAEAVREYRAATALETSDPLAAINAWHAWRSRWSQTALAHGADLRLLALLDKLERKQETASLAREFLQRYPRSPRRADVERVLEGSR